jgi:hypothetical protein
LNIRIHPYARARLAERGATESEVFGTIEQGERFPAKFGRTGFRRNFAFRRDMAWQALYVQADRSLTQSKKATTGW